jgi:hypothetical protein
MVPVGLLIPTMVESPSMVNPVTDLKMNTAFASPWASKVSVPSNERPAAEQYTPGVNVIEPRSRSVVSVQVSAVSVVLRSFVSDMHIIELALFIFVVPSSTV